MGDDNEVHSIIALKLHLHLAVGKGRLRNSRSISDSY